MARRIEWWQRELAGGGAIFGAFVGERLVGFALVARRRNGAEVPACSWIPASAAVELGGRLLGAMEGCARDAGASLVHLHPNTTASAVGFYRKHGYVLTCLVDEATLGYPGMETCVVLAKPNAAELAGIDL